MAKEDVGVRWWGLVASRGLPALSYRARISSTWVSTTCTCGTPNPEVSATHKTKRPQVR
jgi:hypothetical protein